MALHDTLVAIGRAYANADWSAVRSRFLTTPPADRLLSQLHIWRSERVFPLRLALMCAQRQPGGDWIGTVRFSSDPRAIADYVVYRFRMHGGRAEIVGRESGVQGDWFRTAWWSVTHSAHFTIYHSPYLLRGPERSLLGTLEAQRTLFARRFGVSLPPHIDYYLYPDVATMRRMTHGECGAQSDNTGCTDPFASPPTIQSVEWPTYHEPIHAYEIALQPKPGKKYVYTAPLFIAEGTAVALEDASLDPRLSDYCSDLAYVPLEVCARYAMGRVRPLSLLPDSGFKQADPGDAYALGGSFVSYLIEHGGYRRFGQFYYTLAAQPKDRLQDYEVATHKAYGTSMEHLLNAWRAALCRAGC